MLFKQKYLRSIWLAQSEEHMALDLGVWSSGPMLGTEIT